MFSVLAIAQQWVEWQIGILWEWIATVRVQKSSEHYISIYLLVLSTVYWNFSPAQSVQLYSEENSLYFTARAPPGFYHPPHTAAGNTGTWTDILHIQVALLVLLLTCWAHVSMKAFWRQPEAKLMGCVSHNIKLWMGFIYVFILNWHISV